jgi:hypothetical protein
MYKQHLLFNLEREINLLKQLAPFIEEQDLDFRPHEKVRSVHELMGYLSNIGALMLRWFVHNDISKEEWVTIREERKHLTREGFIKKLDWQLEQVRHYMNLVSEEDLVMKEVELPSKEKMPLGAAIINAPIKWLSSYRMQLFVFLKMNGRVEIGTREAWSVQAGNS